MRHSQPVAGTVASLKNACFFLPEIGRIKKNQWIKKPRRNGKELRRIIVFMLYTRRDLLELMRQQPKHLQSLLIALCWHASQCQPNCLNGNRYGISQIRLDVAEAFGFREEPIALLDPRVNLPVAARALEAIGIVEFCGFEMSHLLLPIAHLSRVLDAALLDASNLNGMRQEAL